MSFDATLKELGEGLAAWRGAPNSVSVHAKPRLPVLRNTRRLSVESLETRTVLSTMAIDPLVAPLDANSGPAETVQIVDPLEIVALHVRVGDRDVTVMSTNDVIQFKAGDLLEISGIDYVLHPSGAGLPGAVAFEGYVRKLELGSDRGRFDYKDGRFGAPVTRDPLAVGSYHHTGLDGSWTLEEGWNRLSIAMVRYFGKQFQVEDRFFLNLEVEQPDFAFDGVKLSRNGLNKPLPVGKEVRITGEWENQGDGRYFTYSEVDIYHTSDPTHLVWVGTLSGATENGDPIKGEYLNKNETDSRPDRWTPERPGTYVLKFYLDPEHVWNETNEENNVLTVKVTVEGKEHKKDAEKPTRDDLFQQETSIPMLVQDNSTSDLSEPPTGKGSSPLDAKYVDQAMEQLEANQKADERRRNLSDSALAWQISEVDPIGWTAYRVD